PPPSGQYFSDMEIEYYIIAFIILIFASTINAVIPADASWAIKLFSAFSVIGVGSYIFNFALYAAGLMTEAAMLSSLVGFFNVMLAALINLFYIVDPFELSCMIIVFGVGALLTIIELLASGGTLVVAKFCLMAIAFVSLGLACYFDWLDSDGIVG
ncbi:unnamed protein product, partial [marine sediment metagenome]